MEIVARSYFHLGFFVRSDHNHAFQSFAQRFAGQFVDRLVAAGQNIGAQVNLTFFRIERLFQRHSHINVSFVMRDTELLHAGNRIFPRLDFPFG
ncbi:hypothetical protein D1872_242590 [compost metagenome]